MNIVVDDNGSKRHPIKNLHLVAGGFLCGLCFLAILGTVFFMTRVTKEGLIIVESKSPKEVHKIPVQPPRSFSIIDEVSASYGIPAHAMDMFAVYLDENDFNEKYGGVGRFSVKPSHLGWLKDSILADTVVNLEDPIQNTQVAAFILNRFHESGYSWGNCFLIYAFGFSAVNAGDRYKDFLEMVFPDGY